MLWSMSQENCSLTERVVNSMLLKKFPDGAAILPDGTSLWPYGSGCPDGSPPELTGLKPIR
jgi:hypothetical protein